jgi:hypothetical protein
MSHVLNVEKIPTDVAMPQASMYAASVKNALQYK